MMNRYKETPINVVGGCEFGRYPKISKEETWNMYISDDWLISFPGYKRVLNLSQAQASSGRGEHVSVRYNIVLCVVNSNVYLITQGFTVSFIGRITTAVGPVSMDENLNGQIGIVDGLKLYIYNIFTKGLTEQTIDKDLLIPNYICYHNTFFLLGNNTSTTNRSKWFALSYATESTVEIVNELSLQTKPDSALAVIRMPGSSANVLVFGRTVTEIWTQVGGIQNYTRNSSLNIDYGCLSVSTIAQSDRYVIWLAINENNDPVIMMFSGNQNIPISTSGIASLLAKINYPTQSVGYFFRKDGHLFYILTFYNEKDNVTFCYDVESKKFSFLTDYSLNYFPPRNIFYFNGETYFLSFKNGSLYNIDSKYTTYDENIGNETTLEDNVIPRIRICASSRFSTTNRFRARNFTLLVDQGNDEEFSLLKVAGSIDRILDEDDDEIVTEQGQLMVTQSSRIDNSYVPRIDVSFSVDGGYTFSNPDSRTMHFLGNRKNIVNFNGPFGLANELMFKVRFYTKSFVCANNATLEIWQ